MKPKISPTRFPRLIAFSAFDLQFDKPFRMSLLCVSHVNLTSFFAKHNQQQFSDPFLPDSLAVLARSKDETQ